MKKVLSILLIIMLIITFIQIRNMYALYKDELSGEYATSLGRWNVKINGTEKILPGKVIEFEMLDGNIRYLDNAFKSTGAAIVPNTEVFFDILFDTSETDVAVKYIIEFGEINSFNVINRETGEKVLENVPNDYEFDLKYPLKFEIQDAEEFFGEYTISSEEGKEGLIEGEETETEFEKKIIFDGETSTVTGVIPLQVSQTVIEGQDGENDKTGLQTKASVKLKWVIDEDTISEENKKEYEEMYQYLTSRNNETEYVDLKVPINVKAIQYLGEDL